MAWVMPRMLLLVCPSRDEISAGTATRKVPPMRRWAVAGAGAGFDASLGAVGAGCVAGTAGAHAARMTTLAPPANRRRALRRLRLELLDPVISSPLYGSYRIPEMKYSVV